jgi:hypothetical protein
MKRRDPIQRRVVEQIGSYGVVIHLLFLVSKGAKAQR